MGQGFFESDEDYRDRVNQEAIERTIEESTGSAPSQGFFESDTDYRSRIVQEANEHVIEDSTGYAPSQGFFESDDSYGTRINTMAGESIVEDSTGSSPSQGFFEGDEDYRTRVSREADERVIEDTTGSAPSQGFFESDDAYRSRIALEARENRSSGAVYGESYGDRSDKNERSDGRNNTSRKSGSEDKRSYDHDHESDCSSTPASTANEKSGGISGFFAFIAIAAVAAFVWNSSHIQQASSKQSRIAATTTLPAEGPGPMLAATCFRAAK